MSRPGRTPASDAPPTTPRAVAGRALDRIRDRRAFANLVLPTMIREARLSGRDAGFVTELVYGSLRMRGAIDWVISLYADRSLDAVDPSVLERLRLGVYQLLYMQVPSHAAVGETVDTVERRAQGFVNAILRKIARSADDIPWPTKEGDLEAYLRIRHSHPGWMVRMWLEELGPHDTEALCAANNDFGGIGIRANRKRTTPGALEAALRAHGLQVEPGRWSPDVLVVHGGGMPTSWPGWNEGHFAVQDESSVLVASEVDAGHEAVVADLCAGPGGKSAHLAERTSHLLAIDLHLQRARLVRQTLDRLGLDAVVVQADGRSPPMRNGEADAVLVDAPCSGLGVLRRRPEARWRVEPEHLPAVADIQSELLRSGFDLLRAGGALVYAVCTVTTEETTAVIERFRAFEPAAELVEVLPELPRRTEAPYIQLLPHVHGTDGMFIAKLRRRAG